MLTSSTVTGEWRHSSGILVDDHGHHSNRTCDDAPGVGMQTILQRGTPAPRNAGATGTSGSGAGIGRVALDDRQRLLMSTALTAHLASRDSCRVAPEETVAVEEVVGSARETTAWRGRRG